MSPKSVVLIILLEYLFSKEVAFKTTTTTTERRVSSSDGTGKTNQLHEQKERKKLDSCLTPCIKINSKEKNDSNVRAKNHKSLRRIHRSKST